MSVLPRCWQFVRLASRLMRPLPGLSLMLQLIRSLSTRGQSACERPRLHAAREAVVPRGVEAQPEEATATSRATEMVEEVAAEAAAGNDRIMRCSALRRRQR